MQLEVKFGDYLEDIAEAKVIKIYKTPGEPVITGEILLEVETNKTNLPIKSPASGEVTKTLVEIGQVVNRNDTLMVINGEPAEEAPPEPEPAKPEQGEPVDYFATLLSPRKLEQECDIAIIGGGPGGYVAAIQAAKLGARVVLVEKDALGGTCLNRGCIPTKALVRSAEIYKNLREAGQYGCSAENVSLDMKKVIARKNNIVTQLVGGIKHLITKHNISLIRGSGEILDNRTVRVNSGVDEITVKCKSIIIATGSRTSRIPIPGADIPDVIYSDAALDLEKLPRRLAIIGGGIIGMEFAFIFANFGTEVAVIEYMSEILPVCDPDISNEISRIARKKGIRIYSGSKVEEITKSEDGECIISFSGDGGRRYITAEKVLMAVGREPDINGLDVAKLGIELNPDGKGIMVNDKMETNISGIYAIGDVTNKVLLAHVASHQGIVAVRNIMGQACKMDYNAVPGCIFTDPEIATVGICERTAETAGLEIEIGRFPFAANGKALTMGETEGLVKIIKDKITGKVIGGAVLGPHATDLIAEIVLAIKNSLTAEQITETIHAHPTISEAVHEAALAVEGGALHFVE